MISSSTRETKQNSSSPPPSHNASSTSSAPTGLLHGEPILKEDAIPAESTPITTTTTTSTSSTSSSSSFTSLLFKILFFSLVAVMLSLFLVAFYNYREYQHLLELHHGDANAALFEFLAVKDVTRVGSLFFASTLQLLNFIENEAPKKLLPPQHRLLQMALLFQQSQAIYECVDLSIADIVHEQLPHHRIHVSDLAKRLQLPNEEYLQRYMKALESLGLFQEVTSHTFANNHLSSYLRSDHPQSMKDFIIHMHKMSKGWAQLGTVLKQGKPFFNNSEFWFHTIGDNQEERKIFMNSMKTLTFLGDDAIIVSPATTTTAVDSSKPTKSYDFSIFESVIDVGGASGTFLAKILQSYPSVKGVLFDLPSVIDDAQETWKQNHLDLMPRVTFASGDFFNQSSLPSQQESNLFILRMILHDWNDQDCIRILENIRYAMQHHESKLLIVESMLQEEKNKNRYIDKYQRLNDMHMLVFGGKERSAADMKKLLEASGFAVSRVIPTFGALSMIEAVPV